LSDRVFFSVPGPFLIVVPLSTIASWQREFSTWLPDFNVVLYTGDAKSREMIREYEWFSPHNKKQCKFHVLVTTPEMILSDLEYFSMIRWAVVTVDEAHRLKNEASALHQALSSLTSANRLLITGTPLQNSIRELWALLNYLHPEKYNSAAEFEEKYDFQALRKPENITSLHSELRPYILRRQKADVEKSLPRKTYAVLRVGLGPLQAQYYRWILTKNFAMLNAGLKEYVCCFRITCKRANLAKK
jgi:chromodomain-helicase-DNA-binding protein 1